MEVNMSERFFNAFTEIDYEGINVETLKKTGLTGGFLTFNQARKMGGFVPKGTKSVARLTRLVGERLSEKGLTEEWVKYPVFHISQISFENNEGTQQ
tara:strand:- start:239 stop:529 length:291 start_codon:yes stop_codon:yes gene_type:complete